MIISIGILARNEAGDIANLIADLSNQTLLSNKAIFIEIHVVANGCTDLTVDVSKKALAAPPFRHENITTFVHSLPQAGKSNAWNQLIHTLASPKTNFIFLLDADIRIPEGPTLQLVLDRLIQSKTACVAVDKSVKDVSQKNHKTIIERLILAASGTADDTRTAIAGALYCARFDVLSGIWMPIGLPGEDGFLRAMILTSNFSQNENLDRVVFVEGARHIFESERTIQHVFRHNIRLAIGTGINVLLFNHIRKSQNIKADVSSYIRERNDVDPNWVNTLIAHEIQQGRYFVLYKGFVLRRLKMLNSQPTYEKIRKGPIFILGFLFDVALFFKANHLMRRGSGAGFW